MIAYIHQHLLMFQVLALAIILIMLLVLNATRTKSAELITWDDIKEE